MKLFNRNQVKYLDRYGYYPTPLLAYELSINSADSYKLLTQPLLCQGILYLLYRSVQKCSNASL